MGTFQARVLLTFFYSVLVFPVGLAMRLFSDSLRIKHLPTHWLQRIKLRATAINGLVDRGLSNPLDLIVGPR